MMQAEGFLPVSIRSVSKHYGPVKALDGVSLDVEAGEFVSLLGPSGSGKTTLLHILGGFVPVTGGSIYFGSRDVTLMPPHKREIGIVFQNYALFPHMTVGENVAFPLKARGVPKAESAERVNRALSMVELGTLGGRRISQLSGGQKQRVALARAIVFEPKLILMDEPLSALDKHLREMMQIELRHLHDKLKATIIYVTHDQREALTMSDRVAVLRDGRLVQVASPRDLHDNPVDDFVARFVGESSLLPVTPTGPNSVAIGDLSLRTTRPLPAGGRLFLALQAEKLLLGHDGAGEEWNHLSGRVTEVIYQGESLKVFVALDGGPQVGFRQPSHHEGIRRLPAVGERIDLSLHARDTIVVPAAPANAAA